MYKDAQAYFDAITAAVAVRSAAEKGLGGKYMVPMDADRYAPEYQEVRRQYLAEREGLYDTERRATSAAWDALKASEHPVIKFMAENCGDYEGHVREILEALPEDGSVDLVALDKVAVNGSWCGEWDRFILLAAEKGLLPADCKIAARNLNRLTASNVDGYLPRNLARRLREAIDAAIAEAVAEALEKAKPAPAKRAATKRTTTRPANPADVKADSIAATLAEPATV